MIKLFTEENAAMISSDRVNKKYIDIISEEPDLYFEDYLCMKDKVKNSSAIYKGLPVPFLYHPYFVSDDDAYYFQKIISKMMEIGDVVTDEYVKNPEFRKKFTFPEFLEDMILIDPGYGFNAPIARFDVFFKEGEEFKFCELNTDGSSAMNEDAVIGKILLEGEGLRKLGLNFELSQPELFYSLVDGILNSYLSMKKNPCPNVAIIDIMGSASKNEFIRFRETFRERGLKCEIFDVRDLKYIDGALYGGDYKIDLVYRRLVAYELVEYMEECSDFIRAYMDGAVIVYGSMRSQVIHTKEFFKVLWEEENRSLFSEEQMEFIRDHVPYTGNFGGSDEVFKKVLKNKDKYILKPNDKNASQGVFAGLDLSEMEWENKLREVFDKDYIYQEFISPYTREYVKFDDAGELKTASYGSVVGLFSYFGKYSGNYVRIGIENIICGLTDYYTAPAVRVGDKNDKEFKKN